MSTSAQKDAERHFNSSVFFKSLNLNMEFVEDHLNIRLDPITDLHRGGSTGDSVNGAVVAAICDIAIGSTMYLGPFASTTGSAVARLDIRMRKPIRGHFLTAQARIDKIARNLIYANVALFDENGNECVDARGTVFVQQI